jgi:hypothetical protein
MPSAILFWGEGKYKSHSKKRGEITSPLSILPYT